MEAKTNAMRMLDRGKVPYTVHTYDHSDGRIDGASVAAKVGIDPERVYKTLVTRGSSGGYFVFVIPVALELDLKKAARACSPVGMKKRYPTVFDSRAAGLETIVVSGGRIGTQVELDPGALMAAVGAKTADLTAE